MVVSVDKIDKRILFEMDDYARIPETKLAKLVNRSKASVRYRINQLEQKGVIVGYHVWVDPTKVGYQVYKIYLKVANKPKRRKEFIDYIKKEKSVFWLGVADGAWDLGITFFAKNNTDFYEFQHKSFYKFRDIILSKKTAVVAEVIISPKGFLLDQKKHKRTHFFAEPTNNQLDDIEYSMLKLLFKNARMSVVELARRTKSTVDMVRTRLKRLESTGVIVCYKASIDHNKIGMEFFKTFLYLSQIDPDQEKKMVNYLLSHPNILHVVKQVGPWEIELEIMVENYLKYTEILNEIKEHFPDEILDVDTAIMGGDYVFPCQDIVFE
jgi:DNA-binding Lrp family transcriptional regulator